MAIMDLTLSCVLFIENYPWNDGSTFLVFEKSKVIAY